LIPFTKAHACGNDFLIITEDAAAGTDWAELARTLCARNTSIGADGIEFFRWTGEKAGRIRLHNADGSVAEISGNGTRCVAAWMAESLGSKPGDVLEIATDAGLRRCRIEAIGGHSVQVVSGMGVPSFRPRVVQLADGTQVAGAEVSTGNPHFVIVTDHADFAVQGRPWQAVGAEICVHPDFPRQTNVEFLRVIQMAEAPNEIEIRIFERGVGPTTSSGTGSSAAATAAIAQSLVHSPVRVVAPGGAQIVAWGGTGTELSLTGPASLIARGQAWIR